VPIGGAFSDTIIQIAAIVAAGLLLAIFVAAARFTMHVRDSIRDQDETLADIGKAVNHVPPGEPRLYDLVVEGVERQAETAKRSTELATTMRTMRGQVERHLRDDEERFAKQDIVLDEVRGVVIDLRDNLEVTAARVEDLNEKVIDLTVTVEQLSSK
jgi:chemotaxis regulatin CheY-phosphate phosphatase CheZ